MTSATATEPDEQLNVDYNRVSEDDAGAADGVDSQHSECSVFAESVGRPLGATYQDNDLSAFSGKERPEYLRLLADVARGVIAAVFVWHADRLTRDVQEGLDIIKLFRKHGVRLFSEQKGGEYLLDRAAGRAEFIADINQASKESGHKGERVSLARKRQARNGMWGGGIRAFGWGVPTGRVRSKCINPKAPLGERIYEDVPVLDMGKHRADERDEIRRWAEELFATKGNMSQLLRSIDKRGIKTVSETDGRTLKYRGKEVPHKGWSKSTVVRILTSPRVSGHQVHNGEVIKWNAYPAILPEEVRQALIVLFSDPSRVTSPGGTPKYLVSLIAGCALCGARRSQRRRMAAKGPVYKCGECERGNQLQELVDEYVTGVVLERLTRSDLISLIKPPRPDVDIAMLRGQIIELQQRKREASLSYARGGIDLELLEMIKADTDAQIGSLRGKLSEAIGTNPLSDFLEADSVEAAFKVWEGLTIGRRREIVRLLMEVTLELGATYHLEPTTIRITPKGGGSFTGSVPSE